MMIKRLLLIVVTIFLIIPQAQAEVKNLRDVTTILKDAAFAGDKATCLHYSTHATAPYITQLFSFDFKKIIPKHVIYGTVTVQGKVKYLQVSAPRGDHVESSEIAFSREDGQWKFDFPATMSRLLGPDWKEQVEQMVQLYQMTLAK